MHGLIGDVARPPDTWPRRARHGVAVLGAVAAAAIALAAQASVGWAASTNVTTYHYDNLRTGWNDTETVLTPANVATSAFGLEHTVAVDEQVDAQPLFLGSQKIGTSSTLHDVAYVVTEANTVYAIDAASGAVLLSRNFGAAVPLSKLPGSCANNSATVGITATPVINTATHTLYVITDTLESGNAVFRLHALDTVTLADQKTPVVVKASRKLSTGATVSLQPNTTRLRAGLLLSNGNVYAGFTSYCDFRGDVTRGWILGWNAATLNPLAANYLTNVLGSSPDTFFLSTIWMSGFGIAADASGNLFFATGNSDPNGRTYNATLNLSESVVKLSPDLTKALDYFTPSGSVTGVAYMDEHDQDLGSGGVMLLPTQPGKVPNLATAMGKTGELYFLNQGNLGHYSGSSPDKVVGERSVGRCWCGESYFTGSDKVGRVVTSGGLNITTWKVQTTPSTGLVQASQSATMNSGQAPSFFTSVSSNSTTASTAIVWAVLHPVGSPLTLHLVAVDPSTGKTLTTQAAGPWPNAHAMANVVPVVANGRVLVASYKQLSIFGTQAAAATNVVTVNKPNPLVAGVRTITGKESVPSQPVFLDWRTHGVPVVGDDDWAQATVAASGTFQAQVTIDHPGTESTMWVRTGDTPIAVAWTATPSSSSAAAATELAPAATGHEVTGQIVRVEGDTFSLLRRDGSLTQVAAANALRSYLSVVLDPGSVVEVLGEYDTTGALNATSIMHVSDDKATWDADR